jgi:hypothetical protein
VRALDPTIIKGKVVPERAIGPAPMLDWIRIEKLVVDDVYQRPIRGAGVTNVARIAAWFRWSCFAPVIVSPISGGLFAIIDGQHRATAAAACGIEAVPCQIIIADVAEQARAFKAINGAVTKMSSMAIHAAAVAAGEPRAMALDEACHTAGVTLLRSNRETSQQKPGQTHAVNACGVCLEKYGRDVLVTALQCVTETTNNEPGMLTGPLIKALCEVLGGKRSWRDAGEALLRAFDEISLQSAKEVAAQMVASQRGLSRQAALVKILTNELNEKLGAAA